MYQPSIYPSHTFGWAYDKHIDIAKILFGKKTGLNASHTALLSTDPVYIL